MAELDQRNFVLSFGDAVLEVARRVASFAIESQAQSSFVWSRFHSAYQTSSVLAFVEALLMAVPLETSFPTESQLHSFSSSQHLHLA